ncbi:MAG: type II toxin-antitoxin system VapC family toxin, partial [Candidatus Dormibacteraeota bacterium]|nr:type II toxin-antitoxin system VapC family toxin [Candidatus Dormibacteraeota bacterium]
DVIIEILRGNPTTVAWIRKQRASGEVLRYSPVTRAEVRAGARPSERAAISGLFESLVAVPIEASTGDLAGDQLARFAASHGVQLGDALIAASAIEHRDEVATFNSKHFPGIKRIVRPAR